jgi:hypothetical protein
MFTSCVTKKTFFEKYFLQRNILETPSTRMKRPGNPIFDPSSVGIAVPKTVQKRTEAYDSEDSSTQKMPTEISSNGSYAHQPLPFPAARPGNRLTLGILYVRVVRKESMEN